MAHILVVEDEASIRCLVRVILELANHRISEAQDGRAAFDILETYPDPVDLIFLDIRMPHMNGIEFLSILDNQSYYPPVIVFTAHWGPQPIPRALEPKINGFLRKPFSRQELLDTVNSQISMKTG
jgi:CheY-like chemotaxis protein